MTPWRSRDVFVAIGLSALSCSAVVAADANAPSAQGDIRPGFSPPPQPDLFRLPPVEATEPAAAAADQGTALHLRKLSFSGNTVVSTADLDSLAAPHIDRDLSTADIEGLRIALTRLYVDRGYVNSGLRVKRIDAASGVIEFDVIEGRLTGIELSGMERLGDDYVLAQLRRPDDGPLNIDRLRERFQLLLDDPLFERMNARLMPGQTPGEAVLAIDVTRTRPYEIRLFANNYRPVSIGAASVGVSGLVRNLTGRGDLLEASLQAPAEGGDDLRGGLAWRMPLGPRTQFLLSLDRGSSSVVEQSVRDLDISSRLSSIELGLNQVVFESLTEKLSLGLQAVHRENRTWLLGRPFSFNAGEPDGIVRENIARFSQELVLRSEKQVLAFRSTFSWGQNNLQDVAGLPFQNRAPTHYRIWLGQAQYARQLGTDGLQFVARGSVQRSPDRLLALDGMALGGVNTVRGFRENQLVRDQGALLNLELEWPVMNQPDKGLRVVLVPFYDLGRGRNHGESATTLQSLGVATRVRWKNFSLDLTLAKRIDPPAFTQGQGASLQDEGVHLQVSWQF